MKEDEEEIRVGGGVIGLIGEGGGGREIEEEREEERGAKEYFSPFNSLQIKKDKTYELMLDFCDYFDETIFCDEFLLERDDIIEKVLKLLFGGIDDWSEINRRHGRRLLS